MTRFPRLPTIPSLFDPEWEKHFIDGFLNLSKELQPFLPYNVATHEDTIVFEMAVAGYPKDNLEVTLDNGRLTIVGKKTEDEQYEYKFRSLSKKNFKIQYPVSSLYEVDTVTLKDGVLKVVFKQTQKRDSKTLEITEE